MYIRFVSVSVRLDCHVINLNKNKCYYTYKSIVTNHQGIIVKMRVSTLLALTVTVCLLLNYVEGKLTLRIMLF